MRPEGHLVGGEGGRAFHLEHPGGHKALLLSDPQAALCALYTHTLVCTWLIFLWAKQNIPDFKAFEDLLEIAFFPKH